MSRPRWLVAAALLVGLVAAAGPVRAQSYEGARLLGFAEAQRALATGNDAIYVNPAGLALAKVYSVELGYLDDLLGSDRRFNASLVDSQAGPVAAGLAYTYTKRAPDAAEGSEQRLEGHRTELSLSTLITESAAIGITARYVTFNRKDGEEDLPDQDFKAFQLDAGLQWRVWEGLSLGLAGYNLTNSDRPELPISWGAGIGWQGSWFSLEGDVRYNAQRGKPAYSLAGGFVIAELIPIRLGATYDYGHQAWSISAGAGFVVESFGLDVGFRQRLKGDDLLDYGNERILAVAIRVLFL
jgi:hypothetical protein